MPNGCCTLKKRHPQPEQHMKFLKKRLFGVYKGRCLCYNTTCGNVH